MTFLIDDVQRASLTTATAWTQQHPFIIEPGPHTCCGYKYTDTNWLQHPFIIEPGPHTLMWRFNTTRNSGSANAAYVDRLEVKRPDPGTVLSVR